MQATALAIFLLFLPCVQNVSVKYNGTECPCFSYYSPPNYQCLLRQLEQNQTLPPLCLQLLQEIDVGHRFKITKQGSVTCDDQQDIYKYVRARGFRLFRSKGEKRLLSQYGCESNFENEQMFNISAERNDFFRVVSRNLELVGLGQIMCFFELIGIEQLELSCQDWKHDGKITDRHLKESFSYTDGELSSVRIKIKSLSLATLGVGFLSQNASEENLSPGSFVIRKNRASRTYLGHLMRFSCNWGDNTAYSGSTASCTKESFLCSCDPCPEKYTMGKVVSRDLPLEPYLGFQRVFKNTIVMKLSWVDDHNKQKLKYEALCRFFDEQDTVYQPKMCITCWKTASNCSDCWDVASLQGHFSPSVRLISSTYGSPVSKSSHMLILQTNHQNCTFPNGSFDPIHQSGSHFHNIFQYDFMFGQHAAYLSNGMKKEKESDEQEKGPALFGKFIILPGYQKSPVDLTSSQRKSLSTICRIRAVFTDNSVGQWSEPVWTTFNRTILSNSAVSLLSPGFMSFLEVSRSDTRISREKEWSTIVGLEHSSIFSNHLFNRVYKFSKKSENQTHAYILNYGKNASEQMKPSDISADNEPLDMKCAALHSFLLWSEQIGLSRYRLVQVNLNALSGKPMRREKIAMIAEKLCGCSEQKFITSPSFDIIYRNLSNPETVEIAAVCGHTICLYNPVTENSCELKISFNLKKYKTVACIIVDTNAGVVFLLITEDNKKVLHVTGIRHMDSQPAEMKNLKTSYQSNIRWIRSENKPSIHLPVPFKHCMDPYIDAKETTVEMSDNSTAIIEVVISWDDSSECRRFLRPSVAVDIIYAKVPDYMTIHEDSDVSCESQPYLECRHLPTSFLHGPTRVKANISELLLNKFYLIDVSVRAAIDQETYDLWYAGSVAHQSQTFRKVLFTRYEQAQFKILWVIISAIITLLLVLIIVGIFYWFYMRKMYIYKHLRRISTRDIQMQEKLGEGNFGEVWKATFGKDTIVVKMLKESATDREEKEFREEALLLSKFNCDSIVQTVGICLQSRPIMLGLEFLNGGSLDQYLRKDEVRSKLQSGDLFHIAEEALKGCAYLEQEGYIHRDIACRNCLITTISDSNIKPKCVKLSDFGLAKDVGVESAYRSRDPDADTLPIAWTAPEAFSGKFSPKSDVWAFGVLVWEIFTWAATPYGLCSDTSDGHSCPLEPLTHNRVEFKVCAERKNLLNFPDPCTAAFCSALKNIMAVCWEFSAEQRPTFKQLQKYLAGAKGDISKTDVQMYFTQLKKSAALQISEPETSNQLGKEGKTGGEGRHLMQMAYAQVPRTSDEKQHFLGQYHDKPCADEDKTGSEGRRLVQSAYTDVPRTCDEKQHFMGQYHDKPCADDNNDSVELLPLVN